MHATTAQVKPKFKGAKEKKVTAERVFEVATATARFFSSTSPITVSLDALAEHLSAADGGSVDDVRRSIEEALKTNNHIFLREQRDDHVVYITTKNGATPEAPEDVGSAHSFARRFIDPPPVPESAPRRRRSPEPQANHTDQVLDEQVSDVMSGDEDVVVPPEAPQPAREPAFSAPPVTEEVTEISDATDEELAQALRDQLAFDYSVANFGNSWMAEDKVPRLSRGDLRRIKDYIAEQGQPVTDHQIVQDLLGIRQSAQEYELHLFAVNFRLSRETREFEFVGIPEAHRWTTSGIETPGPALRKASEVGQDYRVLVDVDDVAEQAEEGVVEHVLTFYEHRHGVLPYDAAFQAIISGPVLLGQRAAIVQFESPLTSQSFPVELRFASGSRGGFLSGFADFFKEHLVPGAFVTIEASDKPGTYTIEFLNVSGQDRKLLTLDEKKNEYRFESVTFYCAPNEDMLVSENRFPKLAGTSPLDERTRRQPAKVLAYAFKYVGEKLEDEGERLMAVMDELVAAANIERPMPPQFIRSIAQSDAHPEFTLDPEADDVVYYRSGADSESAG